MDLPQYDSHVQYYKDENAHIAHYSVYWRREVFF